MQFQDGRDQTQHNTFCRWIQLHLKSTREPNRATLVSNLTDDLKSGEVLCLLAESLVPVPTLRFRPNAKNDLIRQQNVTMALEAFERGGCPLVNIHSSTISKGDLKATLGMCWQLILHYSIVTQTTATNNLFQIRQEMLEWVDSQLSQLDANDVELIRTSLEIQGCQSSTPLHASNMDLAWSDGSVVVGLALSLHPTSTARNNALHWLQTTAADLETQSNMSKPEAFLMAAIELSDLCLCVPQLMSAADLMANPEPNSILTLATYYKNSKFRPHPAVQQPKIEATDEVEVEFCGGEKQEDVVPVHSDQREAPPEGCINWLELKFLEMEITALQSGDISRLRLEIDELNTHLAEYDANIANGVIYSSSQQQLAARMLVHRARLDSTITTTEAHTNNLERSVDAISHATERILTLEADNAALKASVSQSQETNRKRLKRFLELEESLLRSAEIVDTLSNELGLE